MVPSSSGTAGVVVSEGAAELDFAVEDQEELVQASEISWKFLGLPPCPPPHPPNLPQLPQDHLCHPDTYLYR